MSLPFGVKVDFQGPGLNAPLIGPASFSLTQEEFCHDYAVCTFLDADVTSPSLFSGTPVKITYGRPGSLNVFYGYVDDATRMSNLMAFGLVERNAVTVRCFGASWPLRDEDTKSWRNVTASTVMSEIASRFHLDSDIETTTTVWPSLQMAEDKSWWRFATGLAKREGFTFYVNGVRLVFKARQTNPQKITSVDAVFDYRFDPAGMPIFNPTVGASSPIGGQLRTRTGYGVDPRTGKVFAVSQSGSPQPRYLGTGADDPVFTEIERHAANSQGELLARVQGSAQDNQLYIQASAVAQGNAAVTQGSLVFVRNANGSQNGLWFVERVEHQMTPKTYQMFLTLGRDSTGATKSITLLAQTSRATASLNGASWRAA